jgi:enoyl-CoA hydratase/carnithine racemase
MTTLDIQIQGPVARVYLNRPEVRNAFNDGVIAELTADLHALWAPTPRCARSCSAAAARPSAPGPT